MSGLTCLRTIAVRRLAANRKFSSSKPAAVVRLRVCLDCGYFMSLTHYASSQFLACLSALVYSVRREFAPMSEIDAYQSDAPSHPTSRHADFVIAWPTVEANNILQHILVIDSMYT